MYAGRITQSAIFNQIRANLTRSLGEYNKSQQVLTNVKRINRPSDDPVSVVQIMKRKVDLDKTDRYIKNTENAKLLLDQANSVFTDVTKQLERARELALEFANDPSNAQGSANSTKIEIEHLLGRVIDLANTKENGRSIFAGSKTHAQAFSRTVSGTNTNINYNGNMRRVGHQISPNVTMPANVPGVNIFSDGVFQSLIKLSEAVDVERPKNEVVADNPFTTSEISANFTDGGSPADGNTTINDLDRVTTDLDDGDIITISGKDSNGYIVEETFTYGTDNDGTTLGELVSTIDVAYENDIVTIDSNGNVILDSPESHMPTPELTVKFNAQDSASFTHPAINNVEINNLDQLTTPLTDGDAIEISGTNAGGNAVNETFTYGTGNDGTTLGDLVTAINDAFGNDTTATIDDNGYIKLTPDSDSGKDLSLSLGFGDENQIPQFADKITDAITQIDGAMDKVLESQTDLGAKINRLDDNKSMLENVKINIKEFISKEEDADLAEAITEFTAKQTVYNAALTAANKIMQQPTLMDFLR